MFTAAELKNRCRVPGAGKARIRDSGHGIRGSGLGVGGLGRYEFKASPARREISANRVATNGAFPLYELAAKAKTTYCAGRPVGVSIPRQSRGL
jgi:hypothetical protein